MRHIGIGPDRIAAWNSVVCFLPEKRSSSLLQMILGPVSRETSISATPVLCIPLALIPARYTVSPLSNCSRTARNRSTAKWLAGRKVFSRTKTRPNSGSAR
jgi:hypothetical protein